MDRVRPRRRETVFCLLLVSSVLGCGNKGVKTYRVMVTLKYAGTDEAIPGSGIELRPEKPIDDDHRVSCVGRFDDDGTAMLTTFTRGDGVVEGMHRVVLFEPSIAGDWDLATRGPPPPKIPRKYKSFGSSDLTVEVGPDSDNRLDIEIEKPRER